MKKFILVSIALAVFASCVKKKAVKYDPDLVGTWVSYEDNIYTWLIVTPEGKGTFRSYEGPAEDNQFSGEVRYSVFELKMWIGKTKFKVKEWLTGGTTGVYKVATKDYETLNDTTYSIDRKMVLKSSILNSSRLITLYRKVP